MSQKLGQHFLQDKRVLEAASEAAAIKPKDTVVEIGPGHGELTEYLLSAEPRRLLLIEKDKRLAEALAEILAEPSKKGTVKIIEGDALRIIPMLPVKEKLADGEYKIVGNIPYYITGRLLREISELKNKPSLVILTIQKEVAERLTAKEPETNLLAASVRFWSEPKILRIVNAGAFKPAPKVDSALVLLKTKTEGGKIDSETYYRLLRRLFRQPRKTIFNNLSAGAGKEERDKIKTTMEDLEISPSLRPQALSVEKIIELARVFHQGK